MNPPIDPTDNDDSPQELIQNLPSKAARRRVLQASDISLDVNDLSFAEALDELSKIELRQAASQLRFAGARTIHYYRVGDLPQVSPDGEINQSGDDGSSGAYGSEVRETRSALRRLQGPGNGLANSADAFGGTPSDDCCNIQAEDTAPRSPCP